MSFKKILAVVMACAMAIGAFAASALTLDVAEAADETVVAEEAVLSAADNVGGADFATNAGVVFDGNAYYSTLKDALAGVHGVDNAVLYCKPGADLGTLTHGHVCKTLTVYGNGAYISGGEQDFEVDFPAASGNPCTGLTGAMTLTVDNLKGAGIWGSKTSVYEITAVFTNCEEMGKVFISGTNGEFNLDMQDCTFTSNNVSACKVYSNAAGTITLDNVDFTGIEQPVALNNKSTANQNITLVDCDFASCGAATADWTVPVSVKSSVAGGTSTLKVDNCSFTGTVANSIGQDADILLDYGVGETTATVLNTGAKVGVETEANVADYAVLDSADSGIMTNENATVATPVAVIEGTYYVSVQAAIDAATDGAEIVVLADYTGDVTILQKADVDVTLNGNGNKYTGTIYIHGGARSAGAETLTIKNFDFVSDKTIDFISSNETGSVERYAHNVTIEDCTFTGAEGVEVVGLRFRQAYDIVVEDCTFTNMHSAAWATGSGPMAFDTVTITNCLNGISVGTVDSVTVTNSTIEAVAEGGYGIRANAEGAYSLTVENTDIEAYYPVMARYATNPGYALNVGAGSTFTATNPNGYDVVVTTGSDDKPFVKPENDVNITIDETVEVNVYSSHVAYTDGTYFETLDEAIVAANGAEIKALADVELNTKLSNGTINLDLDGHKLTVNVGANYVIGTNVIKNGIVDISNASSSQNIFGLAQYAAEPTTMLIDNVTLMGDGYNSGYGVFEMGNADIITELTINKSTINLKNDAAYQGGLFKGYYKPNTVTVTDSSITLDGADMLAMGVNVDFDNVNVTVTNFDHAAFRNVEGVISNSTITIDNAERGIKNDYDKKALALALENNSYMKIENSTDTDVIVGAGNTVAVDATSTLIADTAKLDDGAVSGNVVIKADIIEVDFVQVDGDAEGYDLYNINLVGANGEVINRLNSADLTFVLDATPVTGAAMDYEIINVAKITVTPDTTTPNENRFMFNFNGKDAVADTENTITIAQVKVSGYGTYTFSVDTAANATNVVHATTISDNIVDTFVPGGATGKGTLDLSASVGKNIEVPTRTLTVNVTFPNSVEKNDALYQDMKVEITGNIEGVHQTVTYDLGNDMQADGSYVVTEARLVLNETYNVVVSGAGYRTARYTVTMTDAKVLNFWNNVKDNAVEVEEGKASSAVTKNFLAGDIVADNNINIYDLSAVVSYFATEITDEADYDKYVKYDLNRDGVIDSKDVAYVLVSWGN